MTRSALRDRFVEEAARGWHREQSSDAHAAGRFAEYCDVVRIAAEFCDIVANPFERCDLIEHPFDSGRRNFSLGHISKAHEAQRAEAIIDRDDHDIAAPGEDGAIIDWLRGRADGESPAVNPDHHGPSFTVESRRPDVQEAAIF